MAYKTQSPDTSPEMEKIYFDLLRRQTVSQRFYGVKALTAGAIHRDRRKIAQRHPDWSEQEVVLHWAETVYGPEIIEPVRVALRQRAETRIEGSK